MKRRIILTTPVVRPAQKSYIGLLKKNKLSLFFHDDYSTSDAVRGGVRRGEVGWGCGFGGRNVLFS